MTGKTHDLIYEIFLEVCDLPPGERERALREACGGRETLDAAVRELLEADAASVSSFDDDRIDKGEQLIGVTAGGTEPVPNRIGPFRVIRLIGEGGMGIVYEAEQDAPSRRVAVKIIRRSSTSGPALRRFRREAEVLGLLQHPGIAQIIESGTHEGRPYIAMEFVDGPDLKRHTERAGLGVRERLELVARVADAVHHAHQKGITHRDLKPDNVLVPVSSTTAGGTASDEVTTAVDPRAEFVMVGQPKVLDFGIARLADGAAGITAERTLQGQLIGTLAYMSPEQIACDADIDTRSDVYALGVLAFEILSGTLPVRASTRDGSAARGATLADAVLRQTGASPVLLSTASGRFRGDIETIVAKAMQADRSRRYQSAAEFAADIRRFLACKPIEARPPSRVYQFNRFCRRNRGLVAAVCIAVIAVLIGSAMTGVSAARNAALLHNQNALLYTAMIDAASRSLSESDIELARLRLADAPAHLRGWEWDHLKRRTEQALRTGSLGDNIMIPGSVNLHWLDDGARFLLPVIRDNAFEVLVVGARDLTVQERIPIDMGEDQSGIPQPIVKIDPTGSWAVFTVTNAATFTETVYDLNERVVVRTETIERADRAASKRIIRTDFGVVRIYERFCRYIPPQSIIDHAELGRVCIVSRSRESQTLSVLSLPSGEELLSVPLRRRPTGGAVFIRGGRAVLVESEEFHFEAFDTEHWRPAQWESSGPLDEAISRIAVIPDVGRVVAGSPTGRLSWFDEATGELLFQAQQSVLRFRAMSMRPNTRELFAVNFHGNVSVWDAERGDGTVLTGHEHWINALAVSPGGGTLVSGDWAGSIRVWDAETGDQLAAYSVPPSGYEYTTITDLDVSDDGARLAVVHGGGWTTPHHVEIRDLRTGTLLERVATIDRRITYARFGPDGTLFVSSVIPVDDDASEHTEKEVAGRVIRIGHADSPVVFSPNEPGLAAVSQTIDDRSFIRIIDPHTMRTVREFGDFERPINSLAFSPDGTRLLLGESSRYAYVYGVERGDQLARLSAHTDHVLDVAWSPDGTRLATASKDGTFAIWDALTFSRLGTMHGHDSYVSEIEWHRQGMIVTGSGDRTLRKWIADAPRADTPHP